MSGAFIDLGKIAVGTSRLYTEDYYCAKLELFKRHQIKPFIGGQFLEFIFATQGWGGIQPYFEQAAEYGVELWDFSTINPLSTEHPPAPGDKRTIMQWFWEPAHYREEYGDLMLSQMLQRSCGHGDTDPVGALLNMDNISAHLSQSRRDIGNFEEEHIDSVKRLRAINLKFNQTTSNSHRDP